MRNTLMTSILSLRHLRAGVLAAAIVAAATCGGSSPAAPSTSATTTTTPAPTLPTVYVVLFTHIEDNVPVGTIGTPANLASYTNMRTALIDMAAAVRRNTLKWVLEPDWPFLEAALVYETPSVTANTGGLNIMRYLKETMGVAIDPHSHEGGGYNLTDVAYLLDRLGVGGSTVVGGHIWLPGQQKWEQYRTSQPGQHYPQFRWRGDILMGAATPDHIHDPVVSGVFHPKDASNYWVDDPTGNIVSVTGFKGDVPSITELYNLAATGTVSSACMPTATVHILPASLTNGGVATVESTVLAPVAALGSKVVTTDFTSLTSTWRQKYGGRGCTYIVSTQ
jgi:hypothetical protein